MHKEFDNLKQWVDEITEVLNAEAEPQLWHYTPFLQQPELALDLVELLYGLKDADEDEAYYSACIFALDVCVAQLQAEFENDNKFAVKMLRQLMLKITKAINSYKHSLSFWLPILNAFYEVHVELLPELKQAYIELAGQEDEFFEEEEQDHLVTIRSMIDELSDLSEFEIAENFFAQSYAMPADFFADLLMDLYDIEAGQNIALLMLLHQDVNVREVVVATFEHLMEHITLNSVSLSRLRAIKIWYPERFHEQFDRWLKLQRKKGVVFQSDDPPTLLRIKASEVDGSGAQGIFIHVKKQGRNYLCGLLLKQDIGIKDAWVTADLSHKEVAKYYDKVFDDSVTLRTVDSSYLLMMVAHFLSINLQQGSIPDLHLLEIQELLGLHFLPKAIDIPYLIRQLGIEVSPFTPEAMQFSFLRSKSWTVNKRFTESWFIENAQVDKLVNRCCSIIEGVKVCAMEEAITKVFAQELELYRDKWLFHFLWVALWAKSQPRKNEKIWQDSFFIAYAIDSGKPLTEIPIMREICRQTVINSIETMNERRTYLMELPAVNTRTRPAF